MRVLGAVLAGGRSARMGTDKALVDVRGRPMASWVADALAAGGAGGLVLVGGSAATGAALGIPLVPDRWPGEGPLGGIATALLDHPAVAGGAAGDQVVVVIAPCDQPGLTAELVDALVGALATAGPDIGCAVPVGTDGRVQPLPAAYRASVGQVLVDLVGSGERRADAGFALVGALEVPVDAAVLVDLDTPADVARWGDDGARTAGDVPGTGRSSP